MIDFEAFKRENPEAEAFVEWVLTKRGKDQCIELRTEPLSLWQAALTPRAFVFYGDEFSARCGVEFYVLHEGHWFWVPQNEAQPIDWDGEATKSESLAEFFANNGIREPGGIIRFMTFELHETGKTGIIRWGLTLYKPLTGGV